VAEQSAGENAVSVLVVLIFVFLILIRVLTPIRFWTDSDFPQQLAATQLVGTLWSLGTKASERSRGAVDLYDKDAIAYAKWVMHVWIFASYSIASKSTRRLTIGCLILSKRAYKESMDIQKHGGRINLPQRLHENLPKAQQQLLSSNVGKSS